jgi:hypothetical protein
MVRIVFRQLGLPGGTLVLLLAVVACSAPVCLAGTGGPEPILLELFTSQGCSSCPPADEWVERLDSTQPMAGAEFIVLSEHVDYWNHDGWKDPYSSAQLTERQEEYESKFGLGEVYTPQIILDGDTVLKLSDQSQMIASLKKAAAAPMLPVRIQSAMLTAGGPGVLTGTIVADGSGQRHRGEVYVAVALNSTQTDILAGENDGKKLTNIAVVRDLVKIGKMDKGKDFQQAFRVKLWSGVDPSNLRLVAFVQEAGEGKVLGATMTRKIATQQMTGAAAQRRSGAD